MSQIHFLGTLEVLLLIPEKSLGGTHLNMCFHLELNPTLLVSFSIKPHPPCLSVKG